MDYKSFINQDLADDPFSLLPEEEKEKLAQQALNLDTERDFLEDLVGIGIETSLPITMMPVRDDFARTFKGPVAAGIRNIIPSWQQSSLGNDKRRTTEEFLVETGEIEPRPPFGFGVGFGSSANADSGFVERAKVLDLVSNDRWNFSRPLDRVFPFNPGFQRCNRVAFVFELSLVYDFSGTDVLSGTPQKKKHLSSDCSDGRPGVDRDIGFFRSGFTDPGTGPPWTQLGNIRKFQFYRLDPAQPQACPASSSADRSLLAEWFCCFGSDSISTEAPMAVQS